MWVMRREALMANRKLSGVARAQFSSTAALGI
jgi:hypothetical protein